MAQYFTDFSEYTAETTPSDWTGRWGVATTITVKAESGYQYLRITGGTNEAASWDEIDSDADRDDVEIYVEYRGHRWDATTNPIAGVIARGNSGFDGYYAGPRSSTVRRIRRYVANTAADVASSGTLGTIPVDTWWAAVFRVEGTALKYKTWEVGGTEPGWEIETTDSNITAAGFVGVYFPTSTYSPGDFRNFGVGTNGDAAPRTVGGDSTAPVLTSPTGTETSDTTATIGATTDEGNGTIYGYVSTSATPPSSTDLKAGTGAVWSGSASVSSTGAKTLNATGLTASTGYYGHLIHTDAAANDSNIVTSAQFTTDAAASPPGTPGAPTFSSVTKTGYLASWSAASGDVDGYEYRINAGSWVDVTTNTSATVTGRTPGATDTVEVRAYGPGGTGTASTADITLPLYGFAFSTASGLVFGAIVGALTDIEVEAEDAEWTVFVHDDEDRSIVLTGSAVTIDAAGRLPDMTSATLDAGAYFVSFRRTSDGAWAAARLTTEDLS